MASFKILRGLKSALPETKVDGRAYFCTDTGEFYVDSKDSSGVVQRKLVNDEELKSKAALTHAAQHKIGGSDVISPADIGAADSSVVQSHIDNKSNPHGVTKSQVGLGSVANTGDSATPVSGGKTKFTTGGAYTELNKKVDKTITVNGKALSSNVTLTPEDVGAADASVVSNHLSADNPHGVDKSDVGLGNVVNTGDSATPVSGGTTKFTTGGAFTELAKKVDKTTTINNKALNGNITLTPGDVGAAEASVVSNHIDNKSNPHGVTKSQVGLSSVVNTGDSATPTKDGTTKFTTGGAYTELAKKVDKTTTINSKALSGNITLTPEDIGAADSGAFSSHVGNKSNPHGVTKSQVGLGSVANTGDSDTPTEGGTKKFTTGGAYTELAKKVDKTTTINDKALSGDITLTPGDIGAAASEVVADHIDDTDNPHSVTKSQVGLGNVANERQYSANNPPPAATESAAGLMSAADKKKLNAIAEGATANTGDITKVTAGNGLSGGASSGDATLSVKASTGISVSSSGVAAKLRSATALTNNSSAATETSGRVYPVAVDKSGYLAVNVPWTDTNTQAVTSVNSKTGAVTLTAADVNAVPSGTKYAASSSVGGSATSAEKVNHTLTINGTTFDGSADATITIGQMTGASSSAAGATGLVPAPAKGAQSKFLRGDGTWQSVPQGDITSVTAGNGLTGGASSGAATLSVGAGTGIVVEADTVSVNTGYTTSGKNYAVQADETSGGLFVNVPWTDTNTQAVSSVNSKTGAVTLTAADVNALPSGTKYAGSASAGGAATKVANKLTIGSKTYDGSAAVSITTADFGLSQALKFVGITTTTLTDGSTTSTVVVGGSNHAATIGDVVLYDDQEFVWTGEAWEELGNASSHSIKGHTHTVSHTPAGTVNNKSITPAGTNKATSITPAGTVGSTNVKPAGTVTVSTAAPTSGQTATYTPAGSVTSSFGGTKVTHGHTFTGTAATISTTYSKSATSTGNKSITPAGSVASTFTGTGTVLKATFTGTSGGSHKHTFTGTAGTATASYTPAGSVSSTFTGSSHTHSVSTTSGNPDTTNVTTIYSITGVGTLPSASLSAGTLPSLTFIAGTLPSCTHTAATLTRSVSNQNLTLSFSGGSISFSAGTLPSATLSKGTYPTLTFSAGSLPTRSSAISMPNTNHTHSVSTTTGGTTQGGTVSSTFTGTAATISSSYTPAGTIANSNVTPTGTVAITASAPQSGEIATYTPAGSVASTFTGTAASHNHSITLSDATASGSYTPAGSINNVDITPAGAVSSTFTGTGRMITATFAGTEASHTHSFTGTPAEHTHTFTGTAASHNHTFTGTAATLTTNGSSN